MMTRLKAAEGSDEDFPDVAALLRRPVQQQRSSSSRSTAISRTIGDTSDNDHAYVADQSTNARLIPKVKSTEGQARRQRVLNTPRTLNSQSTPRTAKAKSVLDDFDASHTPGFRQTRQTPARTVKKEPLPRTCTPSSSEESEADDQETTWCDSGSEEELNDTVIEDDFSDDEPSKPANKPRRRLFSKKELEQQTQQVEYPQLPTLQSPPKRSSLKQFFEQPPPRGPTNPPSKTESDSRPSSSWSTDNNAILRFEPPPRSPRKLTNQTSRPATPPPLSPSKGRLASPSKSKIRIPTPPHKPAADRFWDQVETNTWNESHSPQKLLTSPRKKKFLEDLFAEDDDDSYVSPSESPKKKTAAKNSTTKLAKLERERKQAFEARKRDVAKNFLDQLDQKITNGQIGLLTAETGGVDIVWNKKLNSTAGRAHWKRESVKRALGEEPLDGKTSRARHRAHIELAEKVIDDEDRLLNVLAHEFCHLANFMISKVKDNPHGKEFKAWAKKVSTAFSHLNIHVTTKHSYDIAYKYIWTCVACGHEYKRHSKSIDPAKHGCGACKSKLVQTKPAPRAPAKQSDYQLFIKDSFQRVKKENPGVPLGGLMEILGREYRERKAEKGQMVAKDLENTATKNGVDDLADGLAVVTLEE